MRKSRFPPEKAKWSWFSIRMMFVYSVLGYYVYNKYRKRRDGIYNDESSSWKFLKYIIGEDNKDKLKIVKIKHFSEVEVKETTVAEHMKEISRKDKIVLRKPTNNEDFTEEETIPKNLS